MKLINCNSCESLKIDKSIMSPRISSNNSDVKEKVLKKSNEVKSKIREFQSYIKKNFQNVGNDFTFEARSIHYGNKKSKKGIYGTASAQDIKDLKEEGIETSVVPWIKDNEN